MFDWNHNGKSDLFDTFMDIQAIGDAEDEEKRTYEDDFECDTFSYEKNDDFGSENNDIFSFFDDVDREFESDSFNIIDDYDGFSYEFEDETFEDDDGFDLPSAITVTGTSSNEEALPLKREDFSNKRSSDTAYNLAEIDNYDSWNKDNLLTDNVLDSLYIMPKNYAIDIVKYINMNPEFSRKMIREAPKLCASVSKLVVAAIDTGMKDAAVLIFNDVIICTKDSPNELYLFVKKIYSHCEDWEDLKRMDFFMENLLPLLEKVDNDLIQEYVDDWRTEGTKYIAYVERYNKKYAYSRSNTWRNNISKEDLQIADPLKYSNEEEYRKAVNRDKYSWRDTCREIRAEGLNVDDYETLEEFRAAYNAAEKLRLNPEVDTTIYYYCGVVIGNGKRVYSYRAKDDTYEIGDKVIVPVGNEAEEIQGTVVSVGQYLRQAVPYPLERTKFIIGKN